MRRDPHRAVEAEAARAPPPEHVLGVRLGQEPTAHVQSQDPPLDDRRKRPGTLGIETDRRVEVERAAILAVLPREQPVGDRQVEVRVRIQPRAEAVQEGHGAEAGVGGQGAPHGVTKLAPNDPEQDAQDRTCEIRVPRMLYGVSLAPEGYLRAVRIDLGLGG